ncbi:MAG: hypothetical protein AUI14_06210 [Actinobacteria bacterium 13_2_20CM_2_71_6]|nr:MAG: hypothetical protein AUI14_06210 [Actinobacteria bacterium 13_2_20CM_2_71_6]
MPGTDTVALEPSCVAWRTGDGTAWYVSQRGTGRVLRVTRPGTRYEDLGRLLDSTLEPVVWPRLPEGHVPDRAVRPGGEEASGGGARGGGVVGDGTLAAALRDRLVRRDGAPVLAVYPFLRPRTLAGIVRRVGRALPVFGHDNVLVVGPVLSRDTCPCVRCLYGRLYANAGQPAAFAALCAATEVLGAGNGPFAVDALDVLTADRRRALVDSVLARVADVLVGWQGDPGTATAYTLDWTTGAWRRRTVPPLPGDAGDHAWKVD